MIDSFEQLSRADPLQGVVTLLVCFALYIMLGIVPLCAFLYLIYYLLTLPMRRNERARLFLDLLELGIKDGHTPEAAILDAATSRDRALGVRFHLVAEWLGTGLRLSHALENVPRFVPPQIKAMLASGERIGDLSKVLPACRQLLRDGISQVRSAHNYLIILAFGVTPFALLVPILFRIKVLPSFKQVFEGMMDGTTLPAFTRFVFDENDVFLLIQLGILCVIWLLTLFYLGGPRLRGWLGALLPGVPDWFLSRLPWRWKRLQRDFSAMLAVLLDSDVPETEAVALAGEATANSVLIRRAATVQQRLKSGIKLPEAIRALDDAPEFQWRLSNALQRGAGFLRALTGWQGALDAKAFQLEQAAAQVTTTVLVLLNGAIVACIVIAIFLALIKLIEQAILW